MFSWNFKKFYANKYHDSTLERIVFKLHSIIFTKYSAIKFHQLWYKTIYGVDVNYTVYSKR